MRPALDGLARGDRSWSGLSAARSHRLSTALFLLLAAAALLPLAAVLGLGWLQLRDQLELWTLPSVEAALSDADIAQRDLSRALHRALQRASAVASQDPPAPADSIAWAPRIRQIRATSGADLIHVYARERGSYVRVVGSPAEPDFVDLLLDPRDPEFGPEAPTLLRRQTPTSDWLAATAPFWVGETGRSGPAPPAGALVAAVRLPVGTVGRMESAAHGAQFYRRLGEVGRLLRVAYLGGFVAIGAAALAGALLTARWAARRVSRPVESLAQAMDDLVRGGRQAPSGESSFREVERLRSSFETMQHRLATSEARLRASEQVRGVRTTARFVAHEIRNSLTPIRTGLELLTQRVSTLPHEERCRAQRALDLLLHEADRMARLASAFAEYAHLPPPRPEPIELGSLVETIAEAERIRGVSISVDASASPLPLVADRDATERVVRNLLRNAVEAAQPQGQVRVKVDANGDEIALQVADDGPGMDEATAARAFDLGFSTKESGSGLGLALVRRTVVGWGGSVRIETARGTGCRVCLTFPRNPTAIDAVSDSEGEDR